MSGSDVTLEMFPGLEAPGKARARLASAFAGRIDPKRLLNLQVAVSELIAVAVRTDEEKWIGLRVHEEDGALHGVVTDGGFTETLRGDGGAEAQRLARLMIDGVTREWGTRENEAWFRV